MAPAASKRLKIDILVESNGWEKPRSTIAMLRRALREAAVVSSIPSAEVAIVLADDSAIRLLNRQWRGVNKATNVLSFPTEDRPGEPPLLGDIVLAYETIAREAQDEGKPFTHHVAHLAVHGFLHLLGYDHQRSRDADIMERLERRILRRLAVPNPYRIGVKPAKREGSETVKVFNKRR
ncbi:MAG: rRNA maturation RNase YbeY [Xanthobacteraceae bacterium]